MIAINPCIAAQLLERNRFRYYKELSRLRSKNPQFRRCLHVFADGSEPSVLMLVEETGSLGFEPDVWVSFTGYDETFLKDCVSWLYAKYEKFRLATVDQRVILNPHLQKHFHLEVLPCRKDFVCTSIDRVPYVTMTVTKLTETDRAAVERYPEEPDEHSAGFLTNFRTCVLEGHGEIFVIKEEKEILGYLAYSYGDYGENTCGMYFIHVRQDRRNQGLGTQLAAAYAREKLLQGVIPFFENAVNEASERTALKAGFVCCREEYRADALLKDRP